MVLHPCIVLILVGSVHHDKIAVIPNLIHNQVIHHAALFIAHGTVSGLALRHDRIVIGEEHVQILKGIRSFANHFPHV